MRSRPTGAPAVDDEFVSLYREYAPRVRALAARRLPARDLRDDVVQETFLRAYRSFDTLETDRPPWPWLRAIADNICIDMLRRLSRCSEEPAAEADLEQHGTGHDQRCYDDDPAASFLADQRRAGIRDALGAVHPRQRRALVLAAHGVPRDEVAVLEGTTTNAVKASLQRGRATFRTRYLAIAAERGLLGLLAVVAGRALVRARLEGARAQRLAARITPVSGELALPTSLVSAVVCMSVLGGTVGASGAAPAEDDRSTGTDARVEAPLVAQPPTLPLPAVPPPSSGSHIRPTTRASPPTVERNLTVRDDTRVTGTTRIGRDERRISVQSEIGRAAPERRPADTDVWVVVPCEGSAVRTIGCQAIDAVAAP